MSLVPHFFLDFIIASDRFLWQTIEGEKGTLMPDPNPCVVSNPATQNPLTNPEDPVSFTKVFEDEVEQIRRSRAARQFTTEKKTKSSLIGLAFSGGGIRSATFNLGILQALAQRGLLRKFDYLSTVSGGGYIGSWLAALTQRLNTPNDFRPVEEALKQETYQIGERAECASIHWLRKYADYLTPQMGVLSPDTGAAVGTWLRNVILNLAVILLFLLGAILVPPVVVLFNWNLLLLYPTPTFIAGTLLIVLATLVMAVSMTDFGTDREESRNWLQRNRVPVAVMAPFFVAAWLMNGAVWIWQDDARSWLWVPAGAAFYGLIWLVAFPVLKKRAGEVVSRTWLVLSAVGAGALAGVMLNAYSWVLTKIPINYDDIWIVVIGGTVAVIVMMLLVAVVQLGLLGASCEDLVREWWSREGGQLLVSVVVWVGAFSMVIFGPLLVLWVLSLQHGKGLNLSALLAWVVSSVAGLVAGKSPDTSGEKKSVLITGMGGLLTSTRVKEVVAKVAPYIFVGGLLVILSTAVHVLVGWYFEPTLTLRLWPTIKTTEIYDTYWAILSSPGVHWYWILAAAISLALLALLLSRRVDVNDFSMHHFYRNRLVRCYLGASNRARSPQQFTGFDPQDDIPLAALHGNYPGPYPILNASLNTASGKELGFEERKAKSFVFTPLYCGYEPSLECIHAQGGTYLPTRLGRNEKLGPKLGITLGTAMAISGAAASPNMGHYTSAATAFFMTLFDVRLGWWIGNTRCVDKWKSAGPRLGLAYLLSELVAHSDEDSQYVYLSDGGHFENLAIYELVKRRCRLIVACDSGADAGYGCGDLMSAIEKCRTDFGVDIKISVSKIKPETGSCCSPASFTLGEIHYGPQDVGRLIYIKASLPVDDANAPLGARLAAGVRSYADTHQPFPHQSTADQWFDEVQFEAYRALGEYIGSVAGKTIDEEVGEVLDKSRAARAG
jgi:hypothetical protein